MTLKDARQLAGLTQSAMDREAGLPTGTTHDIETGRNANPTIAVVLKLVGALRTRGLDGATVESIFQKPHPRKVA